MKSLKLFEFMISSLIQEVGQHTNLGYNSSDNPYIVPKNYMHFMFFTQQLLTILSADS